MTTSSIVRRYVRCLLESSPIFRSLPAGQRIQTAVDTVRVAASMADPDGLVSCEFRAPLLKAGTRHSSGTLTVPLSHTLKGGTTAFDELLSSIDFPSFVAGLIHGVFHAIVDASIQQMEAYPALIANVAANVDAFRSDAISDQAARDMLVREFPDLFCHKTANKVSLAWRTDVEPSAQRRLQAALGPRDLEPNLRRLVAATRRRLARNRQQTLATVVLMGITRIVVTDGMISSKIKFDLERR